MSTQYGRLGALAAVLGLALMVPATANAGSGCPEQQAQQTFLPWNDPAWYVPAPDGGVENGADGWTLSGGAEVQDGNESFDVGGAGDAKSLKLPMGSTAATPPMCIGVEHPTVRFFARNTGSPLSLLSVSVRFRGIDGILETLPIGVVAADGSWSPTAPLPVLANLLALVSDQEVSFRFEPIGLLGRWSIDDVYVDPYRKG
jgi:hypothetical protein